MSDKKEAVLITGGTGMIGNRLRELLKKEGYEPLTLSREKQRDENFYHWNVKEGVIEREALERAEHVIHLAGAGIADERWTKERKQVILDSRLQTADLIYNSLKDWELSLKSFISSSAIGYYGDRGEDLLTEDARPGNGFLSEVCVKWEEAADKFEELDIRVAKLRIGLVLSLDGGMLKETYKPLKFGMAPYFGDGGQYYSWVHIDDVCRGFIHLLKNNDLKGPFNMVGNEPSTNKEFVKTLKKVSGKPGLTFSVPKFALKFIFGEMSTALLNSDKVSAERLINSGFKFEYRNLEEALKGLLK